MNCAIAQKFSALHSCVKHLPCHFHIFLLDAINTSDFLLLKARSHIYLASIACDLLHMYGINKYLNFGLNCSQWAEPAVIDNVVAKQHDVHWYWRPLVTFGVMCNFSHAGFCWSRTWHVSWDFSSPIDLFKFASARKKRQVLKSSIKNINNNKIKKPLYFLRSPVET